MIYNVFGATLNLALSIYPSLVLNYLHTCRCWWQSHSVQILQVTMWLAFRMWLQQVLCSFCNSCVCIWHSSGSLICCCRTCWLPTGFGKYVCSRQFLFCWCFIETGNVLMPINLVRIFFCFFFVLLLWHLPNRCKVK